MTSAFSCGLLYGGLTGWITASWFLLMELLRVTPLTFGLLQIPVFGGYILGAQLVKPLLGVLGKEQML